MSLYFIANNLHFALELIGSLVFFVMAWLALDSYAFSKQSSLLFRVVGFSFVGVWQIINAFSLSADLINYVGFFLYLIGLVLVLASFFFGPQVAKMSAVLVIPAFSSSSVSLEIFATILLVGITFLSFRQSKREFNLSLRPFYLGFLSLSIAALLLALSGKNSQGSLWYMAGIFEVVGFGVLSFWVWQYLRLRIRESMTIIFISMTLFIATIVTLAFSTILISKIEGETKNNLLVDAKVFDFAVSGLSEEASAKTNLIANDDSVKTALVNNDLSAMENVLSKHLDGENLGFLLVIDQSGTVVLRAHALGERGDSVANERAVQEALTGNIFTTIEFSAAEKLSIRSSSPIYDNNKVVGAVVAGYQLDNALVDRIKKITGLDMTVYRDHTVVATTAFADDGRSRLTGESLADTSITGAVLSQGQTITASVVIRAEPFFASYLPLKNGDGKIVGMLSAAKPQQDILAIANTTNRLTLITVTILLLLLSFPIYILTKRLSEEA